MKNMLKNGRPVLSPGVKGRLSMARYCIGIDFGSLSGRAALVDVATGETVAASVYDYPHGVMRQRLPDGTPLPDGWALQHPADYLAVLEHTVPQLLQAADTNASRVEGIGVDFTSCTVLPVDKSGTPLCMLPDYESRPHAYVKLWQHHGAVRQAEQMTAYARETDQPWLSERFGGVISCESSFPKLWQVLQEDPALCPVMDQWVEAGDWIVRCLTGRQTRGGCGAGFKTFYDAQTAAYPPDSYFRGLDPALADAVAQKLTGPVLPVGACAGYLTADMAQKLHLRPGIPMAAAHVDAHVCVPAAGMTRPGQVLAILGTSTCFIALSQRVQAVPGISGAVWGGVIPGLWGYEAGQSCTGDMLRWFTETSVPQSCRQAAAAAGLPLQSYLTRLAEKLRPGESGLLALDWWNGNRSILSNADLSGAILGLTVQTRPEEVYRALIEATAFGARVIVENYRAHGIPVDEFFASGGISMKNPMAMQIYADVLHMPVQVPLVEQGPALGSAIFAAAAAGVYPSVEAAAGAMGTRQRAVYTPDEQAGRIYDRLYAQYLRLHDYFGRGENDVMAELRTLKNM